MVRRGRYTAMAVILSRLGCVTLFTSAQDHFSTVGGEVGIPHHFQDGEEFEIPIPRLIQFGESLFTAKFTVQEGAGRPLSKGTGAPLSDPNSPPNDYQAPYFATSFDATQRFWWSCPYYNGGSPLNFVPDLTITRRIFRDTDNFWKYQITKSGASGNKIKLPNQ